MRGEIRKARYYKDIIHLNISLLSAFFFALCPSPTRTSDLFWNKDSSMLIDKGSRWKDIALFFNSFVLFVQSLSCVWFSVIPWTAIGQAPLSSTISWNLLKFMSIELVMLRQIDSLSLNYFKILIINTATIVYIHGINTDIDDVTQKFKAL